jgi:hypothetical protein
VELPDGRRRSIRRAVTDFDFPTVRESTKEKEKSLPKISVRTLLPLAYYVRVMSTSDKEVTHENRVPPAGSTSTNHSTHLGTNVVAAAAAIGQTDRNSDSANTPISTEEGATEQ